MRALTGFAVSAIASASAVSAAVAVVPTGEATAEVMERPIDAPVHGQDLYREADIASVTIYCDRPNCGGATPGSEASEDISSTSTTTVTTFSTKTVATSTITVSPTQDPVEASPAPSSLSSSVVTENYIAEDLKTGDNFKGVSATLRTESDTTTTVYRTAILTVIAQEIVTDYVSTITKNNVAPTTIRPDLQLAKRQYDLDYFLRLKVENYLCKKQNDISACWVAWMVKLGFEYTQPFSVFPTPPSTNTYVLKCSMNFTSGCPEETWDPAHLRARSMDSEATLVSPSPLPTPTLEARSTSQMTAITTPPEVPRRAAIHGRAIKTDFNVTTNEKTITIPAATTTILVTGDPPPPATRTAYRTLANPVQSESSAPKVAIAIAQVQTESTGSLRVKATTVVKTVTMHLQPENSTTADSTQHTSQVPAINTIAVTPVGNVSTTTYTENTSGDTEIYLNISTFSMTGFTPTGVTSTTFTYEPTENSTNVVTKTKTTKATNTDDTMGFTGAVTSTLGSDSSTSVDFGGAHVPAAMILAMAACFALALLL